ncbi:MAG: chemotaxis protein CheW [Brevinema sp.]
MEKQFVAFKIASSFYCIDIMEVQEVIRESQITSMPNFPSFVEGVINLRGTITPLLSIDKRLSSTLEDYHLELQDEEDPFFPKMAQSVQERVSAQTEDKKTNYPLKLIIVNVDSVTIGLLVDNLDKILTVEDHQIQSAEGLGKSTGHKMVAGILQVEGNIYTVLDPRYILENNETQQITELLNQ